MHEQEVCCVLDFYVDQSCQRRGFGKLLFDYMLKVNCADIQVQRGRGARAFPISIVVSPFHVLGQASNDCRFFLYPSTPECPECVVLQQVEGIDPTQIAYDRPSPKLFRFLSKHFHLSRHVPQPNLFAIFEGFKLLDCGETIQVDDNASITSSFLADGSKAISINPALKSSLVFSSGDSLASNNTKPITVNRALQSSLVFNSQTPLDSSGNSGNNNTAGTRPVAVNRALQSSLVFGSGTPLDSSGNPSNGEKHQPMKRVSSAFASSFSLSSGGPPVTPRTGTTSARLSHLFASSIVFADPISTD